MFGVVLLRETRQIGQFRRSISAIEISQPVRSNNPTCLHHPILSNQVFSRHVQIGRLCRDPSSKPPDITTEYSRSVMDSTPLSSPRWPPVDRSSVRHDPDRTIVQGAASRDALLSRSPLSLKVRWSCLQASPDSNPRSFVL